MAPDAATDVARTLQRGLLPRAVPEVAGLTIATHYRTSGTGDVGGDWYDVLDLPADGVACVIGDVSGHGIEAAVTMAQLRFALRAFLLTDTSPARALANLNRLARWLLPEEVATVMVAVFADDSDEVRIASAGHLPPLRLGDTATGYVAVDGGAALGLDAESQFAETVTRVGTGDGLLLFTDGLVERRGESIDAGLDRLARAGGAHRGDDLLEHLVATVPDSPGDDDLAAVAVCRAEAG